MSDQPEPEAHRTSVAPAPAWLALRVLAEIYADFQQFRIAAGNRAERGGVGLADWAALRAGLDGQEKELARRLRDAYRNAVPEPIRRWQAGAVGLGEHTFARLLGILGHPRRAHPWHWEGEGKDDRHLVADPPYDRSVSQLWSYCGVGDATRRRRVGMTAEEGAACGSPRLRSLMYVIAEGCVKQARSPYRRVYDEARVEYATRVDEAGKPWPAGRQHAAAMRLVAKVVLRDLWLAAGEDEAMGDANPITSPPVLPAASR